MPGPLNVWALMNENLGKRQIHRQLWDSQRHRQYGVVPQCLLTHPLLHAFLTPQKGRLLGPGMIGEGFREEEDAGFGVAGSWWP